MDWDDYFLNVARTVAFKSKDPRTQVGAVIVGSANQILSTGYNGMARLTSENWQEKYQYCIHAEVNAIFNAARHGVALHSSTIYTIPYPPCLQCAQAIIQSGIYRVVSADFKVRSTEFERSCELGQELLMQAGVTFESLRNWEPEEC